MNFIDDNLMGGEVVIFRTRLHRIILVMPAALGVLSLFLISYSSRLRGLLLLTAALWLSYMYILHLASEFAVTNKRVISRTGVLFRKSSEILLIKIESIQVNQSIIARILNYGTIIIKGTGGSGDPFAYIEQPLTFRKKIQEQVDLIL